MLRFVEEILLLLLRDEDGKFYHVSRFAMDRAIGGAILMDLAMENRIDTDLEDLMLLDATPTGDSLLDPTLAMIAAGEKRNALYWVEQAARAFRRDPGGGAVTAGGAGDPGTPGGFLPLGVPFEALPGG